MLPASFVFLGAAAEANVVARACDLVRLVVHLVSGKFEIDEVRAVVVLFLISLLVLLQIVWCIREFAAVLTELWKE